MNPDAYLVISAKGEKSLHLDAGRAVEYAIKCHGVVYPLYVKPPYETVA